MMPTSPSDPIIKLAIVGHTNTGKTSLLRTLAKDPNFGEVKDSPGTTRHVEGFRLNSESNIKLEFFDTPGLEDGIALLDYFEQLLGSSIRHNTPDSVLAFLTSPESKRRFEQEARVLRKLMDCDAGLYVIDVRDPVLSKHKDELAILSRCAKPIIPVLNFLHTPDNYLAQWHQTLSTLGLHVIISFDTIAPSIDSEELLYQKLALVLPFYAQQLQELAQEVHQQRIRRHEQACAIVAELLIDVAAFKLLSESDDKSIENAVNTLQKTVKEREYSCVKALLKHYQFNAQDYPQQFLPLDGQRWGMDLFHPQAIVDTGIKVSKGFAAGAIAGATIDLFTAGISLGAATLIGGAIGGLWQGTNKLGNRLLSRIKGYQELSTSDEVLRLLGIRELQLVHTLDMRGHADTQGIKIDDTILTALKQDKLPTELDQARAMIHWSSLNKDYDKSTDRQKAVSDLARKLH